MKRLYAIAYDIPDDTRRVKLANRLIGRGAFAGPKGPNGEGGGAGGLRAGGKGAQGSPLRRGGPPVGYSQSRRASCRSSGKAQMVPASKVRRPSRLKIRSQGCFRTCISFSCQPSWEPWPGWEA